MEVNGDADDLDEDIHRLQIVLQNDEEKEAESDAEGELQSLHQDAEDEHRSYISRSRPSTRPSTCSDVTASSYPPTSVGPEGEDRYQLLDPANANPESCLAMNRAYQEVLLDLLRQTEMSLNENRLKQKELEEEIDRLSSGSKYSGYKNIGKTFAVVTIPYFKNKAGESPADNADVQAKQDLQESKQHVRPQTSWSKFGRKKLISAVAMDTLEKMLRPVMSRLELESEKMRQCRNQEEIDACKDRIETLQEEIAIKKQTPESELIKNVSSDKVDWMKIGVTGFDCKMDAADCERTWKNILRPEINRDKWSDEEEADLQILVEKHNMRNWAIIAEELGTNRTPFQCLQHYQQHSQVYDNSPWTPEEDELLKEVVETCKFGKDTVQFHQVAYYIDGRSSTMCKKRWEEINPQKRRGRWTAHEDCLLMAGVQMFGNNNWLKVGELVPTRNVGQCRERWVNVLCPDLRPKVWNYEEDKELLRLVQEHGPNWSHLVTLIPGRTDNNILQRYRRLMTWKQQCEDFFAMPEKVQKNMILGQRALEQKRKTRGKKRKYFPEKKPNLAELKWYKKQENLQHYSDVGYLAKQLETADDVYSKIIEDRENNQLVAPRPLPIIKYTFRNSLAMWNRKCHLQSLVEAEIKKVLEETKDSEYQPKEVADRVAATLEPAVRKRQRTEISRALTGKDPSELTVRELLRISRSIKETGKAVSDTEEPEVKEESDDSFDEGEIVGTVEQKRKRARPMDPDHKKKMMEGRGRHFEINRTLQKVIWAKYKRKNPTKSSGKRKKYRLFSKKVFKSHGSTEEQEKLRRKSLLLMLKSMDVDSVRALKKARKWFKKYSAFLNLPVEDKNDEDDKTGKSSTDNTRHSLRQRSRSSIVDMVTRPSKPKAAKAEMSETTKLMLELGKELNVPEDESGSENDDAEEEVVPTPRKKRKSTHHNREKTVDTDKTDGDASRMSEGAQNTDIAGSEKSGCVVESQGASEQEKDNKETSSQENVTSVQQKENAAADSESVSAQNRPVTGSQNTETTAVENTTKSSSQQSSETPAVDNTEERAVQNKEGRIEAGVERSAQPDFENQSQKSTTEVAKSATTGSTKEDSPVQPYTKKLPFIPPNYTNLLALKTLLLNKEKLFNKAADDFKVPELRKEFYEKPRSNTTPFVKTLLSVINPDIDGIRRRKKRKLNNDAEKNSFLNCMDNIKKSREFNQLKARFCAVFTWPALISTVKPPKDGQLVVPGSAAAEQNGKDSEKENYDGVSVKKEVIDSSDESSESEIEMDLQTKRHRQRKEFNSSQNTNSINENEDEEGDTGKKRRGRPKYGGKFQEMISLVYRDLEAMGDVELTDKEEMEIIVMNIITRRLGDKKKEIPVAQFNRERGKTLRRLGMYEKMRKLEEKPEGNGEVSEAEQEPKPKKKRRPRERSSTAEPVEPRRSTRLSHHKPLEVHARRKNKEHMIDREESLASPTLSEDTEIIIQENNVTTSAIVQGMEQEMVTSQQSEIDPTSTSADVTGISHTTTISETIPADLASSGATSAAPGVSSTQTVSVSDESASSAAAVTPSAMTPMVFTLPPISAANGSTTLDGGPISSTPAPFVFMRSPKPANRGSTSTEATPASGAVSLMFSSPGLSVSSASASGVSPFGLFTLPLLPSMGLPSSTTATTSSAQAATGLEASGLTALTIPPLPLTSLPSTVTTATASTCSSSGTSISSSTISTSATPLMTSLPVLNQNTGAGTRAVPGSVNLQGALGNNLVPMVVFVNPGQLGMMNPESVANIGLTTIVSNSGSGSTSNAEEKTTTANVGKSDITDASTNSSAADTDISKITSHTNDAIKINDPVKEKNIDSGTNSDRSADNTSSVENDNLQVKSSVSDKNICRVQTGVDDDGVIYQNNMKVNENENDTPKGSEESDNVDKTRKGCTYKL